MKRLPFAPRENWPDRLNRIGFNYHSIDEKGEDVSASNPGKFHYWREDVAYEFTELQVEALYEATMQVHQMSLQLVNDLIKRGDMQRLGINVQNQDLIERSSRRCDPHLYGRFDFSINRDGVFKALEYNADTPTSLLESSLAQWYWKEDLHGSSADQFNSIHEELVERSKSIFKGYQHVTLVGHSSSMEDWGNIGYLSEVFTAAGLSSHLCDVNDVGIDRFNRFVDAEDFVIDAMFKLYPWEQFMEAPYFQHIGSALFVEPLWKSLISNKAFMALLWEANPGHPNLLKTSFVSSDMGHRNFVKKPFLSREGSNVSIHDNKGSTLLSTDGPYGSGGFVYQELCPLPVFEAPENTGHLGPQKEMHAVIGSWVVGDLSVGMCVREDVSPITKDTSYFVPHFFR